MIAGYSDVINEEVTPRKPKKLRVMGESDEEFTREGTDVEEEEEESDGGLIGPNELAVAKARSGGRGMIQTSPASKSPAKTLSPKNRKRASSVPTKDSKWAVQANTTPKKTARQTQPSQKAVKPDQPPKGPVKIGRPPKNAVKPDQPLKKAVKLGRPPKSAGKQNTVPSSPILKKPAKTTSGSAPADVISAPLDKKRSTAKDAQRKPKAMAPAGRVPSNGSQAHVPPSETVSQKKAPVTNGTTVRIVTVTRKVLGLEGKPMGNEVSGRSLPPAKSVVKVVQQTTPMSDAVTRKRPSPVEPILARDTKRSKGSTTPESDLELTDYMSANEDS